MHAFMSASIASGCVRVWVVFDGVQKGVLGIFLVLSVCLVARRDRKHSDTDTHMQSQLDGQ